MSFEHIINCKIKAPNDINGNSRKGWILTRLTAPPGAVFVSDVGSGDTQLDNFNCATLPYAVVNVTAAEYKAWKRSEVIRP